MNVNRACLILRRAALVALAMTAGPLRAEESASDVIGVTRILCAAGADTVVGVPFERFPVFDSTLREATVTAGPIATLTPVLEAPFANNRFGGESHYLRFVGGGSLSGAWFEIVGNTTDKISIRTRGLDLSLAVVGDAFEVIPYWTLDSLFPPESQTTLHVSSGKLPPQRRSMVLLADTTREGIRLAPDRIFFLTEEGWFRSSRGMPPAGGQILKPGEVLAIRHPAGVAATWFRSREQVLRGRHWEFLRTRTDGPQDNAVALVRALPLALEDLGLTSEAFVSSESTAPADRRDELHLYENLTQVVNRIPTKIFFKVGDDWREDNGTTYPVANLAEVPIGVALVIRKAPTADGATAVWINPPTY